MPTCWPRALALGRDPPACRNETFNITNGDVFTMRNVWPVLADAFGMEVGDDEPMSLAGEMPGARPPGRRSCERFGLRAPVELDAFVGQSFIYADLILGHGPSSPTRPRC